MKNTLLVLSCFLFAIIVGSPPAVAAQPLTIQINGSAVAVPPGIHVTEGQVMLPLRWAAEQLGAYSIQWDPEARDIVIKTNEDLYQISKLDYYALALEHLPEDIGEVADRVEKVSLPHSSDRDRKLVLVLDSLKEKYERRLPSLELPPPAPQIRVIVINEKQPYPRDSVLYSFENYNGHFYVPMDWLVYLFLANVNYSQATNQLSIQVSDLKEVEQHLAIIEDALMPATPQEAMQLWGRGEQIRNGALQYAVLSPELRRQAAKRVHEAGWTTGYSSPWVGSMTVKEEKKLSDTAVEYTVTFPEETSVPPHTTATEKFVVRKLTMDGKEGWFITEMLQSSGYGLL